MSFHNKFLLTLRTPIGILTTASSTRPEQSKLLLVLQHQTDAWQIQEKQKRTMEVKILSFLPQNGPSDIPLKNVPSQPTAEIRLDNIISKQFLGEADE